jgi:hypothetical protein
MTNGDIAGAAGIILVPPSSVGEGTPGKVQMGYDQMNRILDTIVLEDNKIKATLTPEGLDAARDLTEKGLAFSSPYFGRLRFQIPDLAFPTELANVGDLAALLNRLDELTARVEALERPPDDDV